MNSVQAQFGLYLWETLKHNVVQCEFLCYPTPEQEHMIGFALIIIHTMFSSIELTWSDLLISLSFNILIESITFKIFIE